MAKTFVFIMRNGLSFHWLRNMNSDLLSYSEFQTFFSSNLFAKSDPGKCQTFFYVKLFPVYSTYLKFYMFITNPERSKIFYSWKTNNEL